jgi:hypothetical protein
MRKRAEEVANAVLYEGYILYPYRPSSVKNQQRWNFGVVYPPGSSEGSARMETQCLATVGRGDAELEVKVRLLHLMARTVAELDEPVRELVEGREPKSHPVQKVECDGQMFQPWQEGVEQEILVSARVEEMISHPVRRMFTLPPSRSTQPLRDPNGRVAWVVVREQQRIDGVVEVSVEPAGVGMVRITARLRNLTVNENGGTRDSLLLRSFVSAHKILTIAGGEFVSLIDPPECCRAAAEKCQNLGTWPVLAGEDGERNVMLSSPIILYDYPQIAPESAGDLCDGTEIDEILSLRILTLTDEEKREMRQSDERGRRILERTESLPEEQWAKLHGVLRGLRPSSEVIQ